MTLAEHNRSCDYEGELEIVFRPRPSNKKTIICPKCLEEVLSGLNKDA